MNAITYLCVGTYLERGKKSFSVFAFSRRRARRNRRKDARKTRSSLGFFFSFQYPIYSD